TATARPMAKKETPLRRSCLCGGKESTAEARKTQRSESDPVASYLPLGPASTPPSGKRQEAQAGEQPRRGFGYCTDLELDVVHFDPGPAARVGDPQRLDAGRDPV